jgi:hypothetical protein
MLKKGDLSPVNIVFIGCYKKIFVDKSAKKTLYLLLMMALNNSLKTCDNDRGPI